MVPESARSGKQFGRKSAVCSNHHVLALWLGRDLPSAAKGALKDEQSTIMATYPGQSQTRAQLANRKSQGAAQNVGEKYDRYSHGGRRRPRAELGDQIRGVPRDRNGQERRRYSQRLERADERRYLDRKSV